MKYFIDMHTVHNNTLFNIYRFAAFFVIFLLVLVQTVSYTYIAFASTQEQIHNNHISTTPDTTHSEDLAYNYVYATDEYIFAVSLFSSWFPFQTVPGKDDGYMDETFIRKQIEEMSASTGTTSTITVLGGDFGNYVSPDGKLWDTTPGGHVPFYVQYAMYNETATEQYYVISVIPIVYYQTKDGIVYKGYYGGMGIYPTATEAMNTLFTQIAGNNYRDTVHLESNGKTAGSIAFSAGNLYKTLLEFAKANNKNITKFRIGVYIDIFNSKTWQASGFDTLLPMKILPQFIEHQQFIINSPLYSKIVSNHSTANDITRYYTNISSTTALTNDIVPINIVIKPGSSVDIAKIKKLVSTYYANHIKALHDIKNMFNFQYEGGYINNIGGFISDNNLSYNLYVIPMYRQIVKPMWYDYMLKRGTPEVWNELTAVSNNIIAIPQRGYVPISTKPELGVRLKTLAYAVNTITMILLSILIIPILVYSGRSLIKMEKSDTNSKVK